MKTIKVLFLFAILIVGPKDCKEKQENDPQQTVRVFHNKILT